MYAMFTKFIKNTVEKNQTLKFKTICIFLK